jgi:hypothetical protein
MRGTVWHWLLLLGPSAAVLTAALRSALDQDGLSQAALGVATGLLVVGWFTNRGIPVLSLVGALASALILGVGFLVVLAAMPGPTENLGAWLLLWLLLPVVYGASIGAAFAGFVGLIWLGPMAE